VNPVLPDMDGKRKARGNGPRAAHPASLYWTPHALGSGGGNGLRHVRRARGVPGPGLCPSPRKSTAEK